MREQSRLLQNMSGASRSTVNVAPHHVEQPRTRATGAKTRASTFVQIHLGLAIHKVKSEDILQWLYQEFALKTSSERILDSFGIRATTPQRKEDWLRAFANQTIAEHGLIGCVVLTSKSEVDKRRTMRIRTLTNTALAFAILTKSSAQLFIAAKTPNLSTELLTRELFTADERIAALVKEES